MARPLYGLNKDQTETRTEPGLNQDQDNSREGLYMYNKDQTRTKPGQ